MKRLFAFLFLILPAILWAAPATDTSKAVTNLTWSADQLIGPRLTVISNAALTNISIRDGIRAGTLRPTPKTTNTWTVTHGVGNTNAFDRALFAGHSWMAGNAPAGYAYPMPYWWTNNFITNYVQAINIASNNLRADFYTSNFVSMIKPYATVPGTNGWLFLNTGLIELWAAETPASLFATVSNICYWSHTNGIYVVVYTQPATDNEVQYRSSGIGVCDANRVAYNELLRNATTLWDYLVDLGTLWDFQLTFYDANGQHPSDDGGRLLAEMTYDALKPRDPRSGTGGTIGSYSFNANQFTVTGTTNVFTKDGPYFTNAFQYGTNMARTIHVDPTNGNDTYGYPYKTFAAAHTAAHNGDTILLAGGYYSNTAMIALKSVTVRGAGPENTYLVSAAAATLVVTNKTVIEDLTVDNVNKTFGSSIETWTNTLVSDVYIHNVRLLGWTDNLFFWGPTTNFVLEGCYLKSGWDNYADDVSVTDTNKTVMINNSVIIADNVWRYAASAARCFSRVIGRLYLNNCYIEARGTNGTAEVKCIDSVGDTALSRTNRQIWVNNCTLKIGYLGVAEPTLYFTVMNRDLVVGPADGDQYVYLNGNYDMRLMNGPLTVNGNVVEGGSYVLGQGITNVTASLVSVGFGSNVSMTVNSTGLVQGVAFKGNGSQLTGVTADATNAMEVAVSADTNIVVVGAATATGTNYTVSIVPNPQFTNVTTADLLVTSNLTVSGDANATALVVTNFTPNRVLITDSNVPPNVTNFFAGTAGQVLTSGGTAGVYWSNHMPGFQYSQNVFVLSNLNVGILSYSTPTNIHVTNQLQYPISSLTYTNETTTNYCALDLRNSEYDIYPTNTFYITGTTNRIASAVLYTTVYFYTTNQQDLLFPSGWVWLGTTNNPPTALAANKVGILSLRCNGASETNIVAAFGRQQ